MIDFKKEIIRFIKTYVRTSGARGVVVGMSGGKDSFVTAKLCVEAIGKERVLGIIMPDGKMKDLELAKKECELLEIRYEVLNIKNLCKETKKLTSKVVGKNLTTITTLNIPPRQRMQLLYAIGGTVGYLVANTSNLSEKTIGYTTKWGDNVGDFAPLADLTKTEVCELGINLGLPQDYVLKPADDGISGKTDEDKIGFTYEELDKCIREGKKDINYSKILQMNKLSQHKRNLISTYETGLKNHLKK